MDFYDLPYDPTESFTAEPLGLEKDETAMLWNDYTWNVDTSRSLTTVE
jgi:hypothetical protein